MISGIRSLTHSMSCVPFSAVRTSMPKRVSICGRMSRLCAKLFLIFSLDYISGPSESGFVLKQM
jgi:hypothetical protein